MAQITYDTLAKLPIVGQYEEAFSQATGVVLQLVPADGAPERPEFGSRRNTFCGLLTGNPAADAACWKCETELQSRAGKALSAQTTRCFAGLQVVAVPVVVEGRHVATWVGGQVLRRKPTGADFKRVVRRLAKWGVPAELPRIKAAFLGSQVVPANRFQAMKRLLTLFAQHLGKYAERWWAVPGAGEPRSVTRAKEFIQGNFTEPVSLAQVAAVAHVSSFHFSRVFRATTGVPFTEYVSRLRIERAKALLHNASARVSEVAYATGFRSISQFNTLFRRYVGKPPTEYRSGQREPPLKVLNRRKDATSASGIVSA